eukprot:g48524.t1
MGEVLNELFALIFTREKEIVDGESQEVYVEILGHVNIKTEVMLGVSENIKVDKSPEPDGIYPRMLREAGDKIAGALYELFVSSLVTGEDPEDWRKANIIPLFMKNNRDILGNYRL